ncbi:MAG: hypothetical protein M0D55_01195 [Elusimicrobiota bacterium]|nr:MAG: hypothetical protein M0D55_01195 [Elusimicrobiota bacterium]
MKCPMCSAAAPDAATECPSCGAIFAKLRERKEREKKLAAEALAKIAAPSEPVKFNPWTGRVIAVCVVMMWMIGFAFYYKTTYSRPSGPAREFAPPPPVSSGLVQDPETGGLKRIPIRRGQPPPPREQRREAPSSADGPRPEGLPPHDPDFDD